MRKLVVAIMLLSLVIVLFPSMGQAASAAPKLYLNGKQLETKEEPRIYQSSTLVPVRVVAEGLGYDVGWDQAVKRVDIQDDSNLISLTVNNQIANVNGNEVQLDTTAMIFNGVTLVPIRFVAENLGLQVYYDNLTKAVHLYKPSEASTPGTGGEGSGSDGSSGETPNGSDGSGSSSGSDQTMPEGVKALVNSVQFDGMASIWIDYEGTLTPNKPFVLTGTDRIVVDLPNAAFADGSLSGAITVDTHPTLWQVRYSANQDHTVRVVLDLKAPTAYNVSEQDGRLQIDVLDPAVTPPTTPPPVTPPVTPPEDNDASKVYKVVIDAGHGGKDPGASTASGAYEKTFNLSIALKVKALLDNEKRISATYTRSTDTFIELADRVKIANDLKADAFVSIHANSYTAKTNGTETYYYRSESKPFAQIMHKYLVKATGLKDNGVRSGNFKVIRETTMPAILIEAGYLSNATDAKALFDSAIQNKIAAAIVSGIKEQLKLQ